jgi:hypothetical protein
VVIILIRRFIRADQVDRFIAEYRDQSPIANSACKGETLTRINEASEVPPALRGFALNGPGCVTYLNIAKWDSWEAFAEHFKKQLESGGFNPEIETAPRQRIVLDVIPQVGSN